MASTRVDSAGTAEYYEFNGHGDTVQLTEGTGAVVKSYDYDAFGNERGTEESDGNPFRYCGEYYDQESGTIYLRARYYAPAVGRFTAEDPAMSGLNWYIYCRNNPIIFVDPTGLAEVLLRQIAERYGATVTWSNKNGGYAIVDFGSQGKKVYTKAKDSDIAYMGSGDKMYVDDEAFIKEWGILDTLRKKDSQLGIDVIFTLFSRGPISQMGYVTERATINGIEGLYHNIAIHGGYKKQGIFERGRGEIEISLIGNNTTIYNIRTDMQEVEALVLTAAELTGPKGQFASAVVQTVEALFPPPAPVRSNDILIKTPSGTYVFSYRTYDKLR